MPLPKIATPTYELVIPSTKKKIKYRPFLVKEEKVLIVAMESEDTKQIASAVKDVIKNCIITRGVKVEELSTFDIEYLFLNIRGKSVGEEVEVLVTCPDDGTTKVPIMNASIAALPLSLSISSFNSFRWKFLVKSDTLKPFSACSLIIGWRISCLLLS